MHVIVNVNTGHAFERAKREMWECLEGGKGGRDIVIILQSQKYIQGCVCLLFFSCGS